MAEAKVLLEWGDGFYRLIERDGTRLMQCLKDDRFSWHSLPNSGVVAVYDALAARLSQAERELTEVKEQRDRWYAAAGQRQDELNKARGQWVACSERMPALKPSQRRSRSFGVQVLIHPPFRQEGQADAHVAFYGCRQSDDPSFYLYGRVIDVTHWQPLPAPPVAATQEESR